MMRSGVLARKIGMSHCYSKAGERQAVTLLSLAGCQVVAQRSVARDGYTAVQLAAGAVKPQRVSQAVRGHHAANQVELRKKRAEFRVDEANLLAPATPLTPAHFTIGQKVDVTAVSMGKGFAGVIKRHNFHGLRASHGVSVSHRSHGSTGNNQDPGRVFKGKKMAGHMGARQVTVQSMKVAVIDVERDLLGILGGVPGPKDGWVRVRDAIKFLPPESATRGGESPEGATSGGQTKEAVGGKRG